MSITEQLTKSKRKRRIITFLFTVICIFLFAKSVNAASASWYEQNQEILKTNDIAMSAIRKLAWWFLSAIVKLCNGTEGLYKLAFNFVDLTSVSEVNTFIEKFKPLLVAFMALSLLYLGYILITTHEKKPNIMTNICIFAICFSCSTLVFSTLNSWTKEFKGAIDGTMPSSAAYTTVNDHMVDLIYLDHRVQGGLQGVNWSSNRPESGHIYGAGIKNERDFEAINYAEVLNYNSSKYDYQSGTSDILKHRLIRVYKNGKYTYDTVEVENGFGWNSKDDADIGNEFYYRYNFDFISGLIELFALIIIFITMSYKVVRVAFELVVARLFAYLYSTELSGGEKIKKIFIFIRDSYILLIVTSICIKVYQIMNTWMHSQGWGLLPTAIFSLFIAFSVIDGPNLVEKLLGMDAGLKSSTARMMAIGRMASGAARTAGKVASVKGMANAVNNVKSGKMSQGGLAAGAFGAAFGQPTSSQKATPDGNGGFNISTTTGRTGGLFSKGSNGGSTGGSPGSPSGGNSGGSPGSPGGGNTPGGGSGGSSQNQGGSGHSSSSPGGGNASGSGGGAFMSGGSSGQTGQAQKGEKGDQGTKGNKGDRGEKGFDGKDGKEGQSGKENMSDTMNKGNTAPSGRDYGQGGGHSFMDRGTSGSSGSPGNQGGSSMPSRSTGTNSNFMNGGGKNGK